MVWRAGRADTSVMQTSSAFHAIARSISHRARRAAPVSLVLLAATTYPAPAAHAANAAPTVSIAAPTANSVVSGPTTITVDAADPDGILRVNTYVDGVLLASDYKSPYTSTWEATEVKPGRHEIKVAAFDASPKRLSRVVRQVVTVAAPSPPLWSGDRFCSWSTLHGDVGLCPDSGPWDVTACVEDPAGQQPWSLRNDPDPADPGASIGRFEVRQGDRGADGGGDRCEIVEQTRSITGMDPILGEAPTPGGEVRVFAFDALYDTSTQAPGEWQYQTVGQWHQSTNAEGCPTSSPLKLALAGPSGAKRLEVQAQQCRLGVPSEPVILFSQPLTTDVWHRWRFEIKWSPKAEIGYVRLTHDGQMVVAPGCAPDGRCMMATQFSGPDGLPLRNHFKLGNYRDDSITSPTVVSYRRVSIDLP